jgi:hypothetical protein
VKDEVKFAQHNGNIFAVVYIGEFTQVLGSLKITIF